VNPENKPTKVNWALPWPSALEICGKPFFNKGLMSGLILLGQDTSKIFFQKKCSVFYTFFFEGKLGLPRNLATIVNLPNIAAVQTNLEKLPQLTIANLATSQDTTLKTPRKEF